LVHYYFLVQILLLLHLSTLYINNMIETLKEIIRFITKKKKFVLIPILIVSLIVGAFLILSQGTAYAPLIYTIF
jgi:hypothetical protein